MAPAQAYHDIDAENWSTLKAMRRSPLHYLHARTHERPDTDTFRRGRLVHSLVLEPQRFELDYAVWDGKVRRGKAWDAFRLDADARGLTVITPAQLAKARAMAAAVARIWTPDAQRELSIVWTDETTGLRCKARIDSINPVTITELKTCADVDAETFSRTMHRLGYHGQLAHYRNGARSITGRTAVAQIVAVEAEEPHDAAIFVVSEDAMCAGEDMVAECLARVRACRDRGVWPGRYVEPVSLELPRWAREDEDVTGLGIDFDAPADEGEEDDAA